MHVSRAGTGGQRSEPQWSLKPAAAKAKQSKPNQTKPNHTQHLKSSTCAGDLKCAGTLEVHQRTRACMATADRGVSLALVSMTVSQPSAWQPDAPAVVVAVVTDAVALP